MYRKLPNIVFGFHGCDKSTYDEVLLKGGSLQQSDNKYDWLGNGIYFWENSVERAFQWAEASKKIKNPAVIGAAIDLGYCLNLTDYNSNEVLRRAYEILKIKHELADEPMPENQDIPGNGDILLRDLDCAVIQQIHEYHKEKKLEQHDSVRGAFIEGGLVYPGSAFKEKTHIQLCIINPNCIKAYFSPLAPDPKFIIP